MNLKKCGCCKIEKPLNEFHADKSRKDGLKTACKPCIIVRTHKNYLKHKKHILEYQKKWIEINIPLLKKQYLNEKIKYTEYLIQEGYKIIPVKENKENLYFINKDSDIIKISGQQFFNKNKKITHKKIIKRINYYGYYVVSISKEFRVHQLIAITYLNHVQQNHRLVVDHIDGNKLNNKIENLQIVTNWQNLCKGRFYKTNENKWKKYIENITY
jgi:hypothetical protein